MSEEPLRLHTRPRGRVVARMYQPLARFGYALALGVITEERTYHAQVEENNFVWVEAHSGVEPAPTFYLDEEVIQALLRALNEQPIRARGDYALDHLRDAIEVRDRLLTLVEKGYA